MRIPTAAGVFFQSATTSALELGRLWDEHDLTGRSGLEDLLVRARCLGE
jgi:hypothetical protein